MSAVSLEKQALLNRLLPVYGPEHQVYLRRRLQVPTLALFVAEADMAEQGGGRMTVLSNNAPIGQLQRAHETPELPKSIIAADPQPEFTPDDRKRAAAFKAARGEQLEMWGRSGRLVIVHLVSPRALDPGTPEQLRSGVEANIRALGGLTLHPEDAAWFEEHYPDTNVSQTDLGLYKEENEFTISPDGTSYTMFRGISEAYLPLADPTAQEIGAQLQLAERRAKPLR